MDEVEKQEEDMFKPGNNTNNIISKKSYPSLHTSVASSKAVSAKRTKVKYAIRMPANPKKLNRANATMPAPYALL